MASKKEKVASKEESSPKRKVSEAKLVDLVVKGMLEKKAQAITIIDLRNIKSAVADYFVLCSANTDTQVDAIRTSVEEEVWKGRGEDVWMKEGLQNREWILLDYADVVAHIFRTDRREFYGLEDLWGDADITVLDDTTAEAIKKPKREPKPKPEPKAKAKKAKAKPNVTVSNKAKAKTPAGKKKSVGKKTASKSASVKKTGAKKSAAPKKKSSK